MGDVRAAPLEPKSAWGCKSPGCKSRLARLGRQLEVETILGHVGHSGRKAGGLGGKVALGQKRLACPTHAPQGRVCRIVWIQRGRLAAQDDTDLMFADDGTVTIAGRQEPIMPLRV